MFKVAYLRQRISEIEPPHISNAKLGLATAGMYFFFLNTELPTRLFGYVERMLYKVVEAISESCQ
jgi:hypothetical protein